MIPWLRNLYFSVVDFVPFTFLLALSLTYKDHSFSTSFVAENFQAFYIRFWVFGYFNSLLVLMDLETENRIASVLLREAAELRRQAEKDGAWAYIEKPNVRHRPNSRFLTATVLGVQQCNAFLSTLYLFSFYKS